MALVPINVNVDSEIKQEAANILSQLGLNMSTAINMFLVQVIQKRGIPFEIVNQTPTSHSKKRMEVYDLSEENSMIEIENNDQKYYIITNEHLIAKYKKRIDLLGEVFLKWTQYPFISLDNKVLLLKNSLVGHNLRFYNQMNIAIDDEKISKLLKEKLDEIHKPHPFICLSTQYDFKNWYELIKTYLQAYIEKAIQYNGISAEDKNYVSSVLELHKNYLETVKTVLIHSDITEESVYYDENSDEIEITKFENVIIGDEIFEYARMRQYENIKSFQMYLKTYHDSLENQSIFWFYIVYFELMTIAYEATQNYPLKNTKERLQKSLQTLKKATNN